MEISIKILTQIKKVKQNTSHNNRRHEQRSVTWGKQKTIINVTWKYQHEGKTPTKKRKKEEHTKRHEHKRKKERERKKKKRFTLFITTHKPFSSVFLPRVPLNTLLKTLISFSSPLYTTTEIGEEYDKENVIILEKKFCTAFLQFPKVEEYQASNPHSIYWRCSCRPYPALNPPDAAISLANAVFFILPTSIFSLLPHKRPHFAYNPAHHLLSSPLLTPASSDSCTRFPAAHTSFLAS